jgi:hypothetical protein
MYIGIFAQMNRLLDHYIKCESEKEAGEYIRKLNHKKAVSGQGEIYYYRIAVSKMKKRFRCKTCNAELEFPVCWKNKYYCLACLVILTNKPLNQLIIIEGDYLEAETLRQICLKEKLALRRKASQERISNHHSKFIGVPGERRISRLKAEDILYAKFVDKAEGLTDKSLIIFTDNQNNVYRWNTSNTLIIPNNRRDDSDEGFTKERAILRTEPRKYEPYYLAFTVKDHAEYNGIKQTVIERVSANIPKTKMKYYFNMLKEQS